MQLGMPQAAPRDPFLDQGYLTPFWTMGSMLEDADPHHVRTESPYYSTYDSASSEYSIQDLLPQSVAHSESQNWTALYGPSAMGSLPEVAGPHLCQKPELDIAHTLRSRAHRCSTNRGDRRRRSRIHVQSELLPYSTFGFASYEAQDLSQYVTYTEEQTWPALHDPWVTQMLPEEVDRHHV